jgi:hypothetical protein
MQPPPLGSRDDLASPASSKTFLVLERVAGVAHSANRFCTENLRRSLLPTKIRAGTRLVGTRLKSGSCDSFIRLMLN